jgi:hypothetical protein
MSVEFDTLDGAIAFRQAHPPSTPLILQGNETRLDFSQSTHFKKTPRVGSVDVPSQVLHVWYKLAQQSPEEAKAFYKEMCPEAEVSTSKICFFSLKYCVYFLQDIKTPQGSFGNVFLSFPSFADAKEAFRRINDHLLQIEDTSGSRIPRPWYSSPPSTDLYLYNLPISNFVYNRYPLMRPLERFGEVKYSRICKRASLFIYF